MRFAPLAALLLAGYCRSEINKCVDAQLAAYDSATMEQRAIHTRQQAQAKYHVVHAGSRGRAIGAMIPNVRDEQERADVAAILAALPENTMAHAAYAEGAETIKLTHLVPAELVKPLTEAFFSGYRRYLQRQGGYFRP
jgi:hypothetical protein